MRPARGRSLRRRLRADRRAARVSRAMATLRVRCESWPIRGTFTISRGSKTTADVVVVELSDTDGNLGRGEAVPYAHYGESLQSVLDQIESLHGALAEGLDRDRKSTRLNSSH